MIWLDSIIRLDMNLSKLWETVKDRRAWRATVHEVAEPRMTYPLNENNNKELVTTGWSG